MHVQNVTNEQLEKALQKLNEKMFDGNIVWKRSPEKYGTKTRFTLTVVKSAERGGRRGFQGQRVAAACWHVHGHFFDAVFNQVPEAIFSAQGKTITLTNGNWEDSQVGSLFNPKSFSEMCDCTHSFEVWGVNFHDPSSVAFESEADLPDPPFEDHLPDPQEVE